jgi:tetratricopeptide (TPR) repeat protein
VLLSELTRANLLTQHSLGRYAFHDLLRAYAREQVKAHEIAASRTAAMLRLLDHYLHTAHGAALVLQPSRIPIEIAPPCTGVIVENFANLDATLAWYTVELPVLRACIDRAAAERIGGYPWQLAWALRDFLTREGLFGTQISIERIAAEAARRLGDHNGQARALSGLALGLTRLSRLDEADAHFRNALGLFTELGDLAGQGYTRWGLAEVAEMQGRPGEAIEHHWYGVEANRAAGQRIAEALALDGIGRCHALLGDYQQAVEYCEQALVVLTELDYPQGIASTSSSLGHAFLGLGNHEQAVACQSRAVELFGAAGYRLWEARSLVDLGDIHQTTGDHASACLAWAQAVRILDELNHPEVTQAQARLQTIKRIEPGS